MASTTQTFDEPSDLRMLTDMVQVTMREYRGIAEHHASDAKISAVFSGLDLAFNRLYDCLAYISDDDDLFNRLGNITVGSTGEETRFLKTIHLDLQSIHAQLERVSHESMPMVRAHLKTIKGVLDRYSGVIELIRTKNTDHTIQTLKNHVILLNDALRELRASVSRLEFPIQNELSARLRRLEPLLSAMHDAPDAPERCMEGTRQNALSVIQTWADDRDPPPIFWMQGFAGSGKSAIASSIAHWAHGENRLMASFFFSRSREASYGHMLPTIVYQFAAFDPDLGRRVAEAVGLHPDIRAKNINIQISTLLERPLRGLIAYPGPPPLIVIDGLDECDQINEPQAGRNIALLIRNLAISPLQIRLFLTSRSTEAVRRLLSRVDLPHPPKIFLLHEDVETGSTQADISLYISNMLSNLSCSDENGDTFFSSSEVEKLALRSGLSFVYAATLIRYISDPEEDPRTALQDVISRNPDRAAEQYRQIDSLYAVILERAVETSTPAQTQRRTHELQKILQVLLVVQGELIQELLAVLSGVNQSEIEFLMRKLSPILAWKPGSHVHLYHSSFLEYIEDRERCSGRVEKFLTSCPQSHLQMATICLQVLNDGLRYNVCDLDWYSRGRPNTEIRDLCTLLKNNVPDKVIYAALHWHIHVRLAHDLSGDVIQQLQLFCETHLTHWIEVLSLMKMLHSAQQGLPRLLEMLQDVSAHAFTLKLHIKLLEDTIETIVAYSSPLDSHAMHIYSSALTSIPESNLKDYYASHGLDRQQSPRLVTPRASDWDKSFNPRLLKKAHHTKGDNPAEILVLSPSGKLWASGATIDPEITVWDSKHGHMTWAMKLHFECRVISLAISSQDDCIAAIIVFRGHCSVCQWSLVTNADTRLLQVRANDARAPVLVRYSLNPHDLILGSREAIYIIEQDTKRCHEYLNQDLVYSDVDGNDWDQYGVREVVKLDISHGDFSLLHAMAWSQTNGKSIKPEYIAAVYESGIYVWSGVSGTLLHAIKGNTADAGASGSVLAFSHDIKYMAWISTVCSQILVTNLLSGTVVSTFVHDDCITIRQVEGQDNNQVLLRIRACSGKVAHAAIAFSHSGSLLASACVVDGKGQHVRIWSVPTGTLSQELEFNVESLATSLAFMQDDRKLVLACTNGCLYLWDLAVELKRKSPTGHRHGGPVTQIAFSKNGDSLVTISEAAGEVFIWDPATGSVKQNIRLPAPVPYGLLHGCQVSCDGSHIRVGLCVLCDYWRQTWNTSTWDTPDTGNKSDQVVEWPSNFKSLQDAKSESFALEMKLAQDLYKDGRYDRRMWGTVNLNQKTGWLELISSSYPLPPPLYLCWLPSHLRERAVMAQLPEQSLVAIGACDGSVSIIDLSQVFTYVENPSFLPKPPMFEGLGRGSSSIRIALPRRTFLWDVAHEFDESEFPTKEEEAQSIREYEETRSRELERLCEAHRPIPSTAVS